MSLRWTSYIAPKPPKGGAQKCKTAVFQLKSHFAWRKTATKFLCVKNVSDRVVMHSLAYIYVWKWLVWDVPFYVKIWRILTHPFAKCRFSIIFACSALAVTLSMGSPLRAFQCTSVRCLAVTRRPCDCFYSILARNTSAVTATEKSSIGSPMHTFQWA